MLRYSPSINANRAYPFAEMEEDIEGNFIRVEDVVLWLRQQRNDIPATGEEMANGLLWELGRK